MADKQLLSARLQQYLQLTKLDSTLNSQHGALKVYTQNLFEGSFQDICLIWSSLINLFSIVERNYDLLQFSQKFTNVKNVIHGEIKINVSLVLPASFDISHRRPDPGAVRNPELRLISIGHIPLFKNCLAGLGTLKQAQALPLPAEFPHH